MIKPRNFVLINGDGDRLELLTQERFFYDPSGLGYDRDEKYRRVGDRFVLVSSDPKQDTISGKVGFFMDDPYEAYFYFVQFCAVKPLVIAYVPNPYKDPETSKSGVTYRRNVVPTRFEKTEVNRNGYLEISVELTPTTPWYKTIYSIRDPSDTDHGPQQWIWDVTWTWGTNHDWLTGDPSAIVFRKDPKIYHGFESDSHSDSVCSMKIYGPAKNPSWTHYVNGVEFEYGKVNVTISASQYLLIDNTTDPYEIALYDKDGTRLQNEYQKSDFSTARFITVKYGRNQIFVREELERDVKYEMEAMIYYESV